MKNKIAVIILNYLGFELCQSCVDSILRELPSTIFLIDNSVCGSEQKRLRDEFQNNAKIHLLFPEENLGFAAGVNLGLEKAAKAGHCNFFLINNDAVLKDGSGPVIVDAVNNHPCTLLSPGIDWDNQRCGYNYYHRYLGLITRNQPSANWGWFPYFTGCALMFDRDVLDRIGYFDPVFFMYGEDVAFCYRAVENGIPLYYIPRELIRHKGSSSAGMASFFYEYHMSRSHFLLSFQIQNSKTGRILSLFLKTFSLSARAFIRSIRYKTLSPLAALFLCPFKLAVRPKKVS